MQYVPSLPPPIPPAGPGEPAEIKNLTAAKEIKGVLEHPASALKIRYTRHEPRPPGPTKITEKRHLEETQEERRSLCRRIRHQPLLSELRQAADRRRNKQRKDDPPEHVDIEA